MPAINALYSWTLTFILWFAVLARGAHDPWAACIVFLALSVVTILLSLAPTSTPRKRVLPIFLPSVLWLVAVNASAMFSYDVETSLLEFWIWAFSVVGFFLFINIHPTAPSKLAFWDRSGWITVGLLGAACMQQAQAWLAGYIRTEAFATLINANVLAGFSLFWLIYYATRWSAKRTWAIAVPGAASLMLLVLTGSLAAWLILTATMAWAFRAYVLNQWREQRTLVMAISLLIVFSFVVLIMKKFEGSSGPNRETGRVIYWKTAGRMLLEKPILGIGIGAYGAAYPEYRSVEGTVVQNSRFAHSSLFEIAAETGVTGLLVLGLWIFYWRRQASLSLPLGTAVAGFLCYSLLNFHLSYFVHKLLLVWILASGMTRPKVIPLLSRPMVRWGLAGFFVLLFPFWAAPLQADRLRLEGYAAEQRGDFEAATRFYRDAISLNPRNSEAKKGIARISSPPVILP